MKDRRSVSVAALGVAIVGVLAFVAGIAGAHTVRFDDRVTIRENPQFHGRVVSQKARCEKRRTVQIYREESGSDGFFDSTKTGDDGRWELRTGGLLTGDFYAKIKRTVIGSAGHRHICKGDRSESIHVQPPPP